MTYYTLEGKPVDLSMDRAGLENLLATLEGKASTEPQDGPVGGMFRDQAELVRSVLDNLE